MVLWWGFVPCIMLCRKAAMGAVGGWHVALLLLGSQICLSKSLASLQELAVKSSKAAGCFRAKKPQPGGLFRAGGNTLQGFLFF